MKGGWGRPSFVFQHFAVAASVAVNKHLECLSCVCRAASSAWPGVDLMT
jgi:hypothetical protein